MIYCVFMGAIVHPVVVHWIWSSTGWLNGSNPNALFGIGMLDFAGGVAVHVNGGGATLVAIIVCGYRNQRSSNASLPPRFEKVGSKKWITNVLPSNSASESVYGIFILWFGFFAFNMGSFYTFSGKSDLVGLVAVNTMVSAGAAALSSVAFSQILQSVAKCRHLRKGVLLWQIDDLSNGTLIGLVAATSNCSMVPTWASFVIGMVAGVLYQLSIRAMERCRLDDPVQAVAVHLVGGFWSCIACALFAERELIQRVYALPSLPQYWGLFMGGSGWHLATALIGAMSVLAFTGGITAVVLLGLFVIDKRCRFQYFFLRSTYDPEQVLSQELGARRDFPSPRSSLGIADVDQFTFAPVGGLRKDSFAMFTSDTETTERNEKKKRKKVMRKVGGTGDDLEMAAISVEFAHNAVVLELEEV